MYGLVLKVNLIPVALGITSILDLMMFIQCQCGKYCALYLAGQRVRVWRVGVVEGCVASLSGVQSLCPITDPH